MLFKTFSNIKKLERGITIVEIVVVIFIISTLSLMLISNFPKILRQLALSRVTYKLAQDMRSVEDMGLSGISVKDVNGKIINAPSFGIYVNTALSTTKYIIYADVSNALGVVNHQYDGTFSTTLWPLCSTVNQTLMSGSFLTTDCPIQIVDISQENPGLSINSLSGVTGTAVSVNFNPPDPTATITPAPTSGNQVGIVLKNTDGQTRTVWVNTSGLVDIQ